MKYKHPVNVQIEFIRTKLGTNETWAKNALIRIFQSQTTAEQDAEAVHVHNGVGFTPVDAQFLTSCAKQLIHRGFLSPKQMAYVYKKMPKYAAQLFNASYFDHEKMDKIIDAAV